MRVKSKTPLPPEEEQRRRHERLVDLTLIASIAGLLLSLTVLVIALL